MIQYIFKTLHNKSLLQVTLISVQQLLFQFALFPKSVFISQHFPPPVTVLFQHCFIILFKIGIITSLFVKRDK